MSTPIKRKLATILSADVAGYSRLMGDDEEATLRLLAAHRAIVDSIIDLHDGRVVNTAGDDVLAEFTSPPPRAPEAEAMKKGRVRGLYLACALLAAAVSAEAEPLSIVSITAPASNCVPPHLPSEGHRARQ